jgi:hypothetical protein
MIFSVFTSLNDASLYVQFSKLKLCSLSLFEITESIHNFCIYFFRMKFDVVVVDLSLGRMQLVLMQKNLREKNKSIQHRWCWLFQEIQVNLWIIKNMIFSCTKAIKTACSVVWASRTRRFLNTAESASQVLSRSIYEKNREEDKLFHF